METHNPGGQEQQSLSSSNFDETIEVKHFFPGGDRQTILDEMAQVLTGGTSIVTLAGEEGSGKTTICRLLKQRMVSGYATVLFPRTVESFEEVLRAAVHELGFASDSTPTDTPGLLQFIVSHLHTHDLRLLIIVDEAERIYLATLERIRKMLDLANQSGTYVQMVLSGTIELHQNFKNLALCNFQQAEERHFSLHPLTEEETAAYLASIRGDEEGGRSFFSSEMAHAIFSSSHGNLRLINKLADEALNVTETDVPSVGIIADAQDNGQKKEASRRRLKRAVPPRPFSLNRRYVAWAGGAAALLGLILLVIYGAKEKPDELLKETETSIAISKTEEVEDDAPAADIARSEQTLPEQKSEPPKPVEKTSETAPSQQDEAVLSSDIEMVTRKEEEKAMNTDPRSKAFAEPPQSNHSDVETPSEIKEDKVSTSAVVDEEAVGEGGKVAAASSGEEQQDRESISEAAVGEDRPDPQPSEEQVQPTPVSGALPDSVEDVAEAARSSISAGPAGETISTGQQEQKQSQDAAVPIAGRPVVQAPVVETANVTTQVSPISAPPQQSAADTVTPPGEVEAVEDEQVVPQMIAAREIVKYREQIAPVVTETIGTENVKIVRKQEDRPGNLSVPATPLVIKVEEQKREPAPHPADIAISSRPAAPVVQAAPPTKEPEKVAPRVAEAPKQVEGVEQLYSRRLAAGTSWVLGNKNDHYTVRLMVITSGDAEKKLKSMLGEKRYREQADKFYILRKESSPDVQYVYYGEYPTMTAARNARNTIPEFLRGYKPYAMSVKGAVERAQQDD